MNPKAGFWLIVAALGLFLLVSGRYKSIWQTLSGHPAGQGAVRAGQKFGAGVAHPPTPPWERHS